ncbi:MAG TPA: A/G-specific adenine glycosylase [Sandaracinaceae bacterium LLY-WYZ-13_1]|nr:A/G-specific adenine glycosylase [Sandaracinaceae bacterium LLY-WYZ-13_1]
MSRARLLRWYDAEARDLPWRRTRDPYAIWVSEIMLQQTRVETVIPYWTRFLERFPTAAALAHADEDEVLAHWSGLGYYRRARLLHRGVREVVERYGGEVPEDPDARRSLPGVGRYTAGAIGSIAFGRAEPIVDGNVARVLSRLRGIDTPLGKAVTDRALWAEATALVEGPRPGDLNQALMELGARVCTPARPACDACPLRADCAARADDRVDELPVPRKKKPPRRVRLAAVVALRGGDRVALLKGEGTLFGGLWATPTAQAHGRRAARAALRAAGLRARLDAHPRGRLDHVLSHRHLDVQVWRAVAASLEPADGRRLVPVDELDRLGTSKLTRRVLAYAVDVPGEPAPTLRLPGV